MGRKILYFRISAIVFLCVVSLKNLSSAQRNDALFSPLNVSSFIKIVRVPNETTATTDLSITGTVNNPIPLFGNNVTITLTAKNLGTSSNSNVKVNYGLPTCYTFISSSATVGAYNKINSTWNIGSMAPSVSYTLTLTVKIDSYDNCVSTATITGNNTSDANLYNNSVKIYIVPQPPASTTDTDGDGIYDMDDLDDDNDGILDDYEKYCDQLSPPNGSWPTSSSPATTPQYSKQLLFFDWNGDTLSNANNTTTKSVTHNGVTYTAVISDYTSTPTEGDVNYFNETMIGDDINTWNTGNSGMIWRYYNVNNTAFKEILNMPENSSGKISLVIKVTAKKGGVEYPVDFVVFDPEATDGKERLTYTTNSGNFKLLEKTGLDPIGANITGENTSQITYIDTQQTGHQANALYFTTGYSPTVIASLNTFANRSKEAFGFAVRLYCDTDEDGIPNFLDTDSDNDGCPDAIEGDEYVTKNLLNSEGSINTAITGGIGTSITDKGVPKVVNPGDSADVGADVGQGIGDSQDKNINKACRNYWKGKNDTNWGDYANWTNQQVPLTNEDVEFATEINNPTVAGIAITGAAIRDLVLDQNRIIGNLINATSYATILPASKALTVKGRVTGSEVNPDKLQILAEKTLPNAAFIVNPTLQNGTPLKVTVQMYARGDNKHPYSWKDIIIGSPTFGHIYTGNYRWQFFGIPVNSVIASPTFYGSYVRKYSEPLNSTTFFQKWIELNTYSTLQAFAGYEITQDDQKTINIQGDLVYGDQTITLTREASGVYDSNTNTTTRYGLGQNIFGNSYTAAINIPSLNFPPEVEKTVYLYNTGTFGEWGNTIGGPGSTEVTDAGGSYRAVPFFPSSIIWSEIPSMQGFLLYYKGVNGTTASPITMTIPYNGAIANTKLQSINKKRVQKANSEEIIDFSYLKIELESNSTRDKLWIFNEPGTSAEFDDGWDGTKFFGTPTAYIYSPTTAGPMQINTNSNIIGTRINFIANYDSSYTIKIKKVNLDTAYPILNLVDLVTNTIIPLDKEFTTYTFTANNYGMDIPRFEIKGYINPSGDTPTAVTYIKKNNVFISNNASTHLKVLLFDIAGHLVAQSTIKPFESTQLKEELPKGVYVIKISGENIQETKKIIVH